MEDFDVPFEEAIKDTVEQLSAQGVSTKTLTKLSLEAVKVNEEPIEEVK